MKAVNEIVVDNKTLMVLCGKALTKFKKYMLANPNKFTYQSIKIENIPVKSTFMGITYKTTQSREFTLEEKIDMVIAQNGDCQSSLYSEIKRMQHITKLNNINNLDISFKMKPEYYCLILEIAEFGNY